MRRDDNQSKDGISSVTDTNEVILIEGSAATQVIIPGGAWFLRGDFERSGPDLIITGPDGESVLIRGYFNNPNPPDLVAPGGAVRLQGQTAEILAGPITPGQMAQAVEVAQVEPIGTVESLEGTVEATRADGTKVTLSKGDPVYQEDVLETAAGAAIGVVFADESTFSLGEEGRMVLDEMIYDPGSQDGSAGVSLLSGAFTFVSGAIAKTGVDNMTVTTPTATIGIRGTAGGGKIDEEGTTTAALIQEKGNFTGELTFANEFGVQTINKPNQAVTVAAGEAPGQPFTMTARQMAQSFGEALKALPNANSALDPAIREQVQEATQQIAQERQAAEEAEQGGEGEGEELKGFKPPREGSNFGEQTKGDLENINKMLDGAKQKGMELEKALLGAESLFGKFAKGLDENIGRRLDSNLQELLAGVSGRVASLTTNQSEEAAPIAAIISKVQAAANKASASETAAAAKKAAVESEIVARGSSAGLDQSSSNQLSSAVTAPLDALGAASALASSASGIMLTAGALLGTLKSGKKIDAQVLAKLQAAADEAELAAAKVEVIVQGAIAAMDVLVPRVIAAATSAKGSGKLSAAESMVTELLQTTINAQIEKKAKEVTNAPAALAEMFKAGKLGSSKDDSGNDVEGIGYLSSIVDTVNTEMAAAKIQITAAILAEQASGTEDVADMQKVFQAMEKTIATVTAAKESAEKASATITAKTASEIRSRAEEALEAAKRADAFKDEAEALVDFSAIAADVDPSIADIALAAFEEFSLAEIAAEEAVTAIASADSSQELAFQYVSGVLEKKKDALAEGASDGATGTVSISDTGALTYSHSAAASAFIGSNVSIRGGDLSSGDTFSVSVVIGSSTRAVLHTVSGGETLADVQASLATKITNDDGLTGKLEASAVSELILANNFLEGTTFYVELTADNDSGVSKTYNIEFSATADAGENYTVANIRTGLIEAINASDANTFAVAESGLSAGSVSLEIGKAASVSWRSVDLDGSVRQAPTAAEANIKLSLTEDNISFAATATATGGTNAAVTFDNDSFMYSTADTDGSLTTKLATVTIEKSGSALSVKDEIVVTDPANETLVPETSSLSSITAIGVNQFTAKSTAADVALETAANDLVQTKADLAGLLMADATARAKKNNL